MCQPTITRTVSSAPSAHCCGRPSSSSFEYSTTDKFDRLTDGDRAERAGGDCRFPRADLEFGVAAEDQKLRLRLGLQREA